MRQRSDTTIVPWNCKKLKYDNRALDSQVIGKLGLLLSSSVSVLNIYENQVPQQRCFWEDASNRKEVFMHGSLDMFWLGCVKDQEGSGRTKATIVRVKWLGNH